MKKLILLMALVNTVLSCNRKPSGNLGVIEKEHKPATAEEMHHKVEQAERIKKDDDTHVEKFQNKERVHDY